MEGKSRLRRMAEATPAGRDRYVDLLRAFSIGVVVLGHWLMAIVYLGPEGITGDNALNVVPGLWLLTWILQVMPLFFFVGGFSNLVTWRSARARGESGATFLRGRVERLLTPTLVFIGVGVASALAATAAGVDPATVGRATEILAKPLWFLAVYVLVTALAPRAVRVHERYGWRAPVALAGAAVVVDVVRLTVVPAAGYLNFAFVWLFAHQLGFFYADGSLAGWSRKRLAAIAAAGLAVVALLCLAGPYSPSLVGMDSAKASNNSPPSVVLVAHTTWLVALAMALRPALTRALARDRVWMGVIAANSMIMTVFLWHLTALLAAVVTLYPLGFPQPQGGSAEWWAWRPIWVGILSLYLAGSVAVFARFERPRRGPRERRALAVPAGLGLACLVAGLAGFAQQGFAPGPHGGSFQPLVYMLLVVVGHRALARPGREEV